LSATKARIDGASHLVYAVIQPVTERENLLKRILLVLSALLAMTLVLAGCGGGAASTVTRTGYHMGNLAPDFTLFGLDGKQASLHDSLGKPVVINFWATD
jgi:hypothetical protein